LSKEIAALLKIGIKTAETHKANGMQKMGMKSRIDIVRYALLKGWLQDTDIRKCSQHAKLIWA
jgi:two-component system response regulator NreC